jgi:hypothetical protein
MFGKWTIVFTVGVCAAQYAPTYYRALKDDGYEVGSEENVSFENGVTMKEEDRVIVRYFDGVLAFYVHTNLVIYHTRYKPASQ